MNWQVGLYLAAILAPLIAFLVEILGLRALGKHNGRIATAAVGMSFVLSLIGFVDYFGFEARGVFSEHRVKQESLSDLKSDSARNPDAIEADRPLAWTYSADWASLGSHFEGSDAKPLPALAIPISIRIDNLAVLMFLLVTFVATLVHVYSIAYMSEESRSPLYFSYLSLFVFAMLGLVASANLFFVFVFWELVGICSYLLIGFWRDEKKNCEAANKAFIVNRVGDVGMLLGLGLLWTSLGTVDIATINRSIRDPQGEFHKVDSATTAVYQLVEPGETGKPLLDALGQPIQVSHWVLTLAGIGILAGSMGKSAQFPLHVWLPDAMAGPTPVSALIHAATMVAAGVYLVGRFYPIFTPEVLLLIAYTGAITLFIAATIALVQTDFKQVLAYSTISQLGFMMLGLGVGGWAAGLFHLMTHACFKALLFLGAGSLYKAVHTYDMKRLGGLSRKLPITTSTMLIATLAIASVPFFSGFYSKDAILAAALFRVSQAGGGVHFLLLVIPTIGSGLTAFYMFRMWFLCFAGESRDVSVSQEAEEEGRLITWPLIALAVPSVFLGWTFWLGLPLGEPILEQMIGYGQPIPANDLGASHFYAMIASALALATGIGAALAFYAPPLPYVFKQRFGTEGVAKQLAPIHRLLINKWYFDTIYDFAFVRSTFAVARGFKTIDSALIDPALNGLARLTTLFSRLQGAIDRNVVDGVVNRFGDVIATLGDLSRRLQTGRLRDYLLFMALATVTLGFGIFAWVR